jgi:membrane associated rhomboid family serine protease
LSLSSVDDSPRESSEEESTPGQAVSIPLPTYAPLWTYVFLGINALVWLAMTAMGGSDNLNVLVFFGAKYNPLIVAGQYWRLLTACFIHIGILHLFFNAYALYSIGPTVEQRFGRSRFLALYILAGLAGSVLSFIGNRNLSAGASGALFGLIGAMIAYFTTYRAQFGQWGKRALTNVLTVAGINLVFGFVSPGIDNLGHIGGLLAGLALGWAYGPNYRLVAGPFGGPPLQLVDDIRVTRAVCVTIGVVILLVILTYLGVRWQS